MRGRAAMETLNLIDPRPEWHSVNTIKLSELYNWGFYDPSDDSWKWDYYDLDQYTRICDKFIARYSDREIGILPPGEWKRSYIRKLNEIMPKYKLLYKAAEDINILQESREFEKYRTVNSDFPQTQLAGNQDYASTGIDHESEKLLEGDTVNRLIEVAENYRDIDVMILDELEILFSTLVTVSVNTW